MENVAVYGVCLYYWEFLFVKLENENENENENPILWEES